MDKKTAAALMAMWNEFPQNKAKNMKASLSIYDQQLRDEGISDQAAQEAAHRFRGGNVEGQSLTFGPSIAEFCVEGKRIQEMLPIRAAKRLEPPSDHQREQQPPEPMTKEHRDKMKFKMALWRFSLDRAGGLDRFAEVNKLGMDNVMALAQEWGFPIPEEMWHLSPEEMRPARKSLNPAPYEIRRQQALDRFTGWSVLHKDISYDQFKSLSEGGQLPIGATWSAALGTIYAKAS